MAIQPRFSQAILNGVKTVEFRKRRLAPDVHTVVIYESAPTQRIVGHFTIARTVQAAPDDLWQEFGHVGGILRHDYSDYFAGHGEGFGLVVGGRERYARPVALTELSPSLAVPQSFSYLPDGMFEQIVALQGSNQLTPSILDVVGRLLSAPVRRLARTATR